MPRWTEQGVRPMRIAPLGFGPNISPCPTSGSIGGNRHRHRDAWRRDDRFRQSAIRRKRDGLDPRNSQPCSQERTFDFRSTAGLFTSSMSKGLRFHRCGHGVTTMWIGGRRKCQCRWKKKDEKGQTGMALS